MFLRFLPGQLLLAQLQVGALLSLLMVLFAFHASCSFVLGVLTILVANMVMAWRFWKNALSLDPIRIVKGLVTGEVLKLTILALLIILIAKWIHLNWLSYALGIVLTQLGGLFYLVLKAVWR